MTRIKENLIALKTIIFKDAIRILRLWSQTLLPSVITTILYFIIFGSLIGQRIGLMDGVSYLQYIAPGLIMMTVITNSYSNVATAFYIAKFQRSIEELLVSPMPNAIILLGFVLTGVFRGILVALLVSIITLLFTHIAVQHFMMMILSLLLSTILFSLAGFINAVYAKKFDDIAFIPTFVLTPLTYLGGVFYSVHMLPSLWQSLSVANPILYLVNTLRYGMLGISDVPVWLAFAMTSVAIIALYFYALHLLKKGTGLRG